MPGKNERQAALLQAVREQRVASQEALRSALLDRGFDVTQATVSRDVRDLRLTKATDSSGNSYYTAPEELENVPPLLRLLPTLYRSSEHAENLLVVRTMTGSASSVALAIDWEEWPEILGTIAGDDTILVICRSSDAAASVASRLESIAGEA